MDKKKEFHTVRGYQLLDQDNKLLTSAMEDYLEMIYRIFLTDKYIRINILSEMLNVKPSSATKMVQKLSQLGFVKYEKYGIVILTDEGKDLGEFLLNRHNIIHIFLETIGINDNLLVETELIEHNISFNTLENIKILNEFFQKTPGITILFKEFKKNYLKN